MMIEVGRLDTRNYLCVEVNGRTYYITRSQLKRGVPDGAHMFYRKSRFENIVLTQPVVEAGLLSLIFETAKKQFAGDLKSR